MEKEYKTDKLFWQLLTDSVLNDRCAAHILTDEKDLGKTLLARAMTFAETAESFRLEAWRHFFKINKLKAPLQAFNADPYTKTVRRK